MAEALLLSVLLVIKVQSIISDKFLLKIIIYQILNQYLRIYNSLVITDLKFALLLIKIQLVDSPPYWLFIFNAFTNIHSNKFFIFITDHYLFVVTFILMCLIYTSIIIILLYCKKCSIV